jgi:hypothetical protein
MEAQQMRKVLSETAYRKLLKDYGVLGKELKSRKRLRFGKAIDSIERMQDLITRSDSWERRQANGKSKAALRALRLGGNKDKSD